MNIALRFVLTAGLIALLTAGAGCQRSRAASAGAAPAAPEIPVVQVVPQTSPDALMFTGRLDALHRVELRARVSGTIADVRFREGDRVRAGDPLVEIDPRPYRARRDQAAAEVARAQATLQLAQQELVRATRLRTANAISVEEAERRHNEVATALATHAAAKAALTAADLELEFTTVRAPVDGRVGRALVTAGNLASANQTALATLVSIDPMRVRFAVDEPTFQRLLSLPVAPELRVSIPGLDATIAATVDYLGNAVDATTGTAEVRATLQGTAAALVDGMFARVELLLPPTSSRVLVPETALGAEQGSRYVLVADSDNKLVHRRVTLGPRLGAQRAIASGVGAGEFIVTGGLQFLRPGMTIRPLKPAGETAAPRNAE